MAYYDQDLEQSYYNPDQDNYDQDIQSPVEQSDSGPGIGGMLGSMAVYTIASMGSKFFGKKALTSVVNKLSNISKINIDRLKGSTLKSEIGRAHV